MTTLYVTDDQGTETIEPIYVHTAACSARLLSLNLCTCDSGAEGPFSEMLNAQQDVGRAWNSRWHGDPRTATPQVGSACSTMANCTTPNVLVEVSMDSEYLRFNGQCQRCGAVFYAVQSR